MEICKKVFTLLFFSFLLLSSCKNSASMQLFFNSEDNLKAISAEKREQLTWTQEIEKNRLNQKIANLETVSVSIALTPKSMIGFEALSGRDSVFPELDNFGSLDVSDIDPNAMLLIESFCNDFALGNECEKYMEEDSIFALVLFTNDISYKKFSYDGIRWLVGKPYVVENVFQVPVRLFNKKKFLDINFYLKENIHTENLENINDSVVSKNEYKILDIEIVE